MKENNHHGILISEYQANRPLYEKMVEEVKHTLIETLKEKRIDYAQILGRAKEVESLREKLERKPYDGGLQSLPDLAGVRIVCLYEKDLLHVNKIIESEFQTLEKEDKSDKLGIDKMGYQGFHFVVKYKHNVSGTRYNSIKDLKCEIQVRTVLQDAWSIISHHLVYKNEESIPKDVRRDINNVMSLLEVAQGVFDNAERKREDYVQEIEKRIDTQDAFLQSAIDYDTLVAYTQKKYPGMGVHEFWNNRILKDIDPNKYKTLKDIDDAVKQSKDAVEAYKEEKPEYFKSGTDYITKSLGFIDEAFRGKHPFAQKTREAFIQLSHLLIL